MIIILHVRSEAVSWSALDRLFSARPGNGAGELGQSSGRAGPPRARETLRDGLCILKRLVDSDADFRLCRSQATRMVNQPGTFTLLINKKEEATSVQRRQVRYRNAPPQQIGAACPRGRKGSSWMSDAGVMEEGGGERGGLRVWGLVNP